MAIGKASDFQIYQEYLRTRIAEILSQNGQAFGAASAGAIRLTTESKRGEFEQASFFQNIAGLISRRDNTSTAAVTDLPLTQAELISVKLSRKIGPAAQTRDAFRKAVAGRFSPTEFTGVLAQMAANGMQLEMLNTALLALRAALRQQAASYVTQTSLGAMDTTTLLRGMAAMGDQSSRIVAWIMHSKTYFDLVGNQIAANITGVSGFNVANGSPITFGRPVIVTDSSSLVANLVSPDVTNYFTLGLVQDAAVVMNSEEEEIVVQDVTGLETLVVRYQGEYAYNLGMKGFRWDTTNGGVNPQATAIGTGTNWDASFTDMKERSGVAIMTL
jgi:hypothetical protein